MAFAKIPQTSKNVLHTTMPNNIRALHGNNMKDCRGVYFYDSKTPYRTRRKT